MQATLLIDFGSTCTKVTAVDVPNAKLLGTAASHTTIQTDINDGLEKALALLLEKTGPLAFDRRLACSSAAGGLRMVTSGLVPELTAEAARVASLGAGAKVIRTFSHQLTEDDIAEIEAIRPEIFLLTGGIDGGNRECIEHNAHMLATCGIRFPVVIAGNRSSTSVCVKALEGWEVFPCPNVMPKLGTLDIEPVQKVIRDLFLRRIIHAKGLSRWEQLVDGILMPTPSAMMDAMQLLSKGTKKTPGIGELVAVDLGGATTDIYSMADGRPKNDQTILKGLPDPFAKRTVEGDLGMRYSAQGVLEAVGVERLSELSGLPEETVISMVSRLELEPDTLPDTKAQAALDFALAGAAIETAVTRHAGTIEQVYTPMGMVYGQTGKDLTDVQALVVTGGAIIHHPDAAAIAKHALYTVKTPSSLKPRKATAYIDRQYILAAMGLLSSTDPDAALEIMKKELETDGAEQYAFDRKRV